MLRMCYVSTYARSLSRAEIDEIGEVSVRNNERDGLTGALFTYKGLFYQILEGEEIKVEACYSRILHDPRHENIFCIERTTDSQRQYGDWLMRAVHLDESADRLLSPIRQFLLAFAHNQTILRKYTPGAVIDGLQRGQNPSDWQPEDRMRIVMFSDIVGYTSLTDELSPAEMNTLLVAYYSIAEKTLADHGGTLSKLTGDGFMAYFPIESGDAALSSAIELQSKFRAHREHNRGTIGERLHAGVGMSAGKVREGNIGGRDIFDYTLLGDPVNLASRLEGATRRAGRNIVFDQDFVDTLVAKREGLIRLGTYRPKGKSEPLSIFSVNLVVARSL